MNLKKLATIIMGGLLIIALGACNQTAGSNSGERTLQEVFEKTSEANQGLDSFSMGMDLKQNMDMNGETNDIDSVMEIDVITDPFNMKQSMTLDMGEGMGKQEMEMYLTDDSLYVYEPNQQQWMKTANEYSDKIIQMTDVQTDLSNQLDQFKEFLDDFTIEEDGDSYILTLDANGEKFNELLTGTIINSIPQNEIFTNDVLDTLNFHQVEYELFINKETFYYTNLNVTMDYELDVEGQKVKLIQDIKQTYSNHNQIDEITVPQEAIDQAVEVEF